MDFEIIDAIKHHMVNGEELLWRGRPNTQKLFTTSDIVLVPITVIIFGAVLLTEVAFILDLVINYDENIVLNLMKILSILLFLLVSFYMAFGRFIYKNYRKRRTIYAVTDKRIVIVKIGKEELTYRAINQIINMEVSFGRKGIGSIRFDQRLTYYKFYENTGLDVPWLFYGNTNLAFFDIQGAQGVYELINNLRRKVL